MSAAEEIMAMMSELGELQRAAVALGVVALERGDRRTFDRLADLVAEDWPAGEPFVPEPDPDLIEAAWATMGARERVSWVRMFALCADHGNRTLAAELESAMRARLMQ